MDKSGDITGNTTTCDLAEGAGQEEVTSGITVLEPLDNNIPAHCLIAVVFVRANELLLWMLVQEPT